LWGFFIGKEYTFFNHYDLDHNRWKKECTKFENHTTKFNVMKSIVLFSCALAVVLVSCKKQTEYRNASLQDTIITPDTAKMDTVPAQDTLTNQKPSDTLSYPKDSVNHKK